MAHWLPHIVSTRININTFTEYIFQMVRRCCFVCASTSISIINVSAEHTRTIKYQAVELSIYEGRKGQTTTTDISVLVFVSLRLQLIIYLIDWKPSLVFHLIFSSSYFLSFFLSSFLRVAALLLLDMSAYNVRY